MKFLVSYLFLFYASSSLWSQSTLSNTFFSFYNKASTFHETNHFDSAHFYLNKIDDQLHAKVAPDSLFVLVGILRSKTFLDQGLNDEGLKILEHLERDFYAKKSDNYLIEIHLVKANILMLNRKLELGLSEIDKAFILIENLQKNKYLFGTYNVLGNIYHRQYRTEIAIDAFQKALEHAPDKTSEASALNNISNCYSDLRNYELALSYLYKSYDIDRSLYAESAFELRNTYFNFGHINQEKNAYKEAIKNYKKSLKIYQEFAPESYYKYENYRRLGQCYQELAKDDSVHYYLSLGIEELKQTKSNTLLLAQFQNSYGNYYQSKGSFRLAAEKFDWAYSTAVDEIGSGSSWVSTYLRNKAVAQIQMGDIPQAKQTMMLGLRVMGYKAGKDEVNTSKGANMLFNTLADGALVYLSAFDQNNSISEIDTAYQLIKKAYQIQQNLIYLVEDQNARIALRAELRSLYAFAVECSFLLYQNKPNTKNAYECFEWSELSKKSIIQENIRGKKLNLFPNVPRTLIDKAANLRIQIVEKENLLEKVTGIDSISKQGNVELFSLKQQLYTLIDTLRDKYPTYYRYAYQSNVPEYRSIKNHLKNEDMIVQFFNDRQLTYIFSLSNDTCIVDRIIITDSLSKAINTMVTHLTDVDTIFFDVQRSLASFRKASRQVYQKLMKKIVSSFIGENIIIIPDAKEAYFPFEVLVTKSPNFDGNDYLMNQFNISYAQSVVTYIEQVNIKSSSNKKTFAGFAPHFNKELPVIPKHAVLFREEEEFHLPGAKFEVEEIKNIVGGDLYLAEDATEKNLINYGRNYQILHLSTHALLDLEDPTKSMLIMQSDADSAAEKEWSAEEISLSSLEADLVVLSACRTGSGIHNTSEGVMSIGRAFFIAGIPSTIMSLWKVPDKTTSRLLPTFYEGIKNNLSKSEALRIAKLDYLKKTTIKELKHPYYWAGFLVYGNPNPISIKSGNSKLVWFLVPFSLLLVSWFYLNKSSIKVSTPA